MKNKIWALSVIFFTAAFTSVKAEENIDEGKNIFTTRCASCHSVGKRLTGPALAGISEKRSFEWIVGFVKSSTAMIKGGDTAAAAIFQSYNNLLMPDHPDLTNDNISNVLAYIKSREAEETSTSQGPIAKPSKKQTHYVPLSLKKDYLVFIGYFAAVSLMIIALLSAVNVKKSNQASEE